MQHINFIPCLRKLHLSWDVVLILQSLPGTLMKYPTCLPSPSNLAGLKFQTLFILWCMIVKLWWAFFFFLLAVTVYWFLGSSPCIHSSGSTKNLRAVCMKICGFVFRDFLLFKCVCMLSHSVVSDSLLDYSLPGSCPWNFPGKQTEVGCHFLLQGIFLTQGPKLCLLCLLQCRWILYLLSHQGSPFVSKTPS